LNGNKLKDKSIKLLLLSI